jgi:flagellum-specific ATP synthase
MKSRDLIQLGDCAAGSEPETDRAILLYPALQRSLMQDIHEAAGMDDCLMQLAGALQEDKAGREAPNRQARPNQNPYRT